MRRRSLILRDAHHEAGHAVVALALGHPVSSVSVIPEGHGVLGGRTRVFYGVAALSGRDRMVELLAGDAAGHRYSREHGLDDAHESRHIMEVSQALGTWDAGNPDDRRVRQLLDDAETHVNAHWADIARMAAILARPPYALHGLTPD